MAAAGCREMREAVRWVRTQPRASLIHSLQSPALMRPRIYAGAVWLAVTKQPVEAQRKAIPPPPNSGTSVTVRDGRKEGRKEERKGGRKEIKEEEKQRRALTGVQAEGSIAHLTRPCLGGWGGGVLQGGDGASGQSAPPGEKEPHASTLHYITQQPHASKPANTTTLFNQTRVTYTGEREQHAAKPANTTTPF